MKCNFFVTCAMLTVLFLTSCNTDLGITDTTANEETFSDKVEAIFTTTAINETDLSERAFNKLIKEMQLELPADEQLVVLEKFAALNYSDLDKFNEMMMKSNILRAKNKDIEMFSRLNDLYPITVQLYKRLNALSAKLFNKPLHRISKDAFTEIYSTIKNSEESHYRSGCFNDGGGSSWLPETFANSIYGFQQQFVEAAVPECDIRVDYTYTVRQRVKGATAIGTYVIRLNGSGFNGRITQDTVHVYVPYFNGWSHCMPILDVLLEE